MTHTNPTDLDLFERLCRKKSFSELSQQEKKLVLSLVTEAEYDVMCKLHQIVHVQSSDEITPPLILKNNLDKAWQTKKHTSSLFQLRIPVYQSVAAAALFFLSGLGLHRVFEKPIPLAQNTVEVVKYVDRPVKQIQYVTLQEKKGQNGPTQQQSDPNGEWTTANTSKSETPPVINPQGDIALTNSTWTPNDTNGISIQDDTIFKKIMVTLY